MSDDPYETLPTEPSDSVTPPKAAARFPWGCLIGVVGVGAILVLLVLPSFHRREAAYRTFCKNNLKQIMVAMHNYHDVHGSFPPAYTTDADGNRLHSWRTLILPHMEVPPLYEKIDLTKPWDHPANVEARETSIDVFQCQSSGLDECMTTYQAMIGDDSLLHPTKLRRFRDIKDGTSSTIGVVEVLPSEAVHWMDPRGSGNESFLRMSDGMETPHVSGVQVALCDGSVRFIHNNLDKDVVR